MGMNDGMKKLLALWVSVVLMSCFAACQNSNGPAPVPTLGPESPVPETPSAAPAMLALSAEIEDGVSVALHWEQAEDATYYICLLYTSTSRISTTTFRPPSPARSAFLRFLTSSPSPVSYTHLMCIRDRSYYVYAKTVR